MVHVHLLHSLGRALRFASMFANLSVIFCHCFSETLRKKKVRVQYLGQFGHYKKASGGVWPLPGKLRKKSEKGGSRDLSAPGSGLRSASGGGTEGGVQFLLHLCRSPALFSCSKMNLFQLKTCTPVKGTPRNTSAGGAAQSNRALFST